MANMTLRDIPDELHNWLKQQAQAHHRSVNKEVIALLERLKEKPGATVPLARAERYAAIMEISKRVAAMPELDSRGADEILGYDENGMPG